MLEYLLENRSIFGSGELRKLQESIQKVFVDLKSHFLQ